MNSINTSVGNTTEGIRSALECIQPDDRETWLRMGMAVKSELGDDGQELWDSWSQGAESYNPTDACDVWRSIKPTGGVTIASLFHTARTHGWQDGTPPPDLSPEDTAERSQRQAKQAEAEAAALERERGDSSQGRGPLGEGTTGPHGAGEPVSHPQGCTPDGDPA